MKVSRSCDFGASHLSQLDSDHLGQDDGCDWHELTCGGCRLSHWSEVLIVFLRFFEVKHSDCDDGVHPDVVAMPNHCRAVSHMLLVAIHLALP